MDEEDVKGQARDKMTFNDPCVMLWRAVVYMAIGDAIGCSTNDKLIKDVQTRQRVRAENLQTQQAQSWLRGCDDYYMICQLADFNPEWPRQLYKDACRSGVTKPEFFRKFYNKLLER